MDAPGGIVCRLLYAACLLSASSNSAQAANAAPRTAVVTIQSPNTLRGTFPGYFATFSAQPLGDALGLLLPSKDPEGCTPYPLAGVAPAATQSVAVVRRGNCSFMEKTTLAQEAGAKGIIIVSKTEEILVMSAGNNTEEGKDVNIFAVSVAKSVGDKLLSREAAHHSDAPVTLAVAVYKPPFMDLAEAGIVCLATSLVVAGAFFSTADLRIGSPIAPRREEVVEVTTPLALSFCVLGSCMLVVLYFFMRYLIYVIIFGFCLGGASCILQIGSSSLQYFYPSLRQHAVIVPGMGPISRSDILAGVPAGSLVVAWLTFRNTPYGWFFQDIIGGGFLCMLQRTLRLPNIKIAAVLLSAMFFFDIFWVFLSPLFFKGSVMVVVATGGGTGETVPMLLRVPAIGDPLGRDRMLGFGDVALPGLLVSYLRRHDILSHKKAIGGFFIPSVVGYFVGLCVTIMALMIMRMGQPALLYLVPSTLGTTLVLGCRRGELKCLWDGTPSAVGRNSRVGPSSTDAASGGSIEAPGVVEETRGD